MYYGGVREEADAKLAGCRLEMQEGVGMALGLTALYLGVGNARLA